MFHKNRDQSSLAVKISTFTFTSCFVSERCIYLINYRLWPIEDICISLYVLKRFFFNLRHILEKVMSMQHIFDGFSEKQTRVELKCVGNVAKTVLVESTNQFSLKELCRTQYSLKYVSLSRCSWDFSVSVGVLFIWLSQISYFFSCLFFDPFPNSLLHSSTLFANTGYILCYKSCITEPYEL